MVRIAPFQGLRYNADKVTGIETVVAPPYDVISPQQQEALHQRNLYNVVRLILGKKTSNDTDLDNVYTRAHNALEAWRDSHVLKPDPVPCIYAYTQSWEGIERRGFIALLGLSPYETGEVLPHEFTLGGPKADRLALFKATGSILSPIFCLYNDPAKTVESRLFDNALPGDVVEVYDDDGVRHRFWPVENQGVIDTIRTMLANKAALIADGHHRFETAVAYQQWRREQDGQQAVPNGELPWDYTMAFFTNMADEGLRIYPTHRVFTSLPPGFTQASLTERLSQWFVPAASDDDALFWLETGRGPKTALALKSGTDLSQIPEPLRPMDVAILDHLVFQGIFGASANDLKQQGHLQFIRDEQEVATLLKQPETVVFWVHAPSVDMVRTICESGYRMPQKSTYFYPKLLSGLVMYYYGTGKANPAKALMATEAAPQA